MQIRHNFRPSVLQDIFRRIFLSNCWWQKSDIWSQASYRQGFQSGPVPGTFTRLRSCRVPAEITETPKISGGQNHKYDGR